MRSFFLLLMIPFLMGTSYYVKNGGSDAADGLSDATAWETMSKVNSFALSSGDTVYFNRGDAWTYLGDTTANRLTMKDGVHYTAYGTGDKPSLWRARLIDTDNAEIDNIHINFAFQTSSTTCNVIEFQGTANTNNHFHDITVDGGLYNCSLGMQICCAEEPCLNTGNIIEDSSIYNCGYQPPGVQTNQNGGGINICGGGYSNIIRNNTLTNNYGLGIQLYDSAVEFNVHSNTIDGNRITSGYLYDNGGGGVKNIGEGINLGYVAYPNNVVKGNYVEGYRQGLSADNGVYGYNLFSDNIIYNAVVNIQMARQASNQEIYNNTSIAGTRTAAAILVNSGGPGTGHKIKNNIMVSVNSGVPTLRYPTSSVSESDNNLFYSTATQRIEVDGTVYTSLAAYQLATPTQDQNSVEGNPLIDPTIYSLLSGSPAINTGVNLSTYFTDDYNGNPRLGVWDIGAVEFTEGTREYINVGFSGVEVR